MTCVRWGKIVKYVFCCKDVQQNTYLTSRLQQLQMLPLMYIYELNDLMFFIKSLKFPTVNFNINQYISFASSNTRSSDHLKLVHPRTISALHHHFYFNCIARLWNYLPVINLSYIIKQKIKSYLLEHFNSHFHPDQICSFHLLCPCYQYSWQSISINFNQL